MPSATQIVPEHEYAHTMVVVNDNSARPSDDVNNITTTYCNMMFVFSSPKGLDNELQTISNGLTEFEEKYGVGSFDLYGQAFLNAYAAASTNAATLHCLRVTADDATYAAGALVAHYKATPGSDPTPPTPTPSDKVNVNGHANVLASDEVDADGNYTITLAGTDVEPGISDKNKAIFGEVTGNYIDIDIDLNKIMNSVNGEISTLGNGKSLDAEKTYQVTQINPALAIYDGKDEFVSNVDGHWQKVKTYTGAQLMEGYTLLVGADSTITISIVEWGTDESSTVTVVGGITNNTDLGVAISDEKATVVVTKDGKNFDVDISGNVVTGVLHPELWGTVNGKHAEVVLTFPGIESDKKYTVIQRNQMLQQYMGTDPTIDTSGTTWRKMKEYNGADMIDGYAVLIGESCTDVISVLVQGEDGVTIYTAIIDPVNVNWVDERPDTPTPEPGPIGEPTVITINSTLAFVGVTTRSVLLRANAKMRAVTRAITPMANETPAVDPSMEVYYTFEGVEGLTDVSNLGNLVPVDTTPDAEGFAAVKIFEIACRGRGKWGNDIRFVIDSYARGDRLCQYKNYLLSIYEIQNSTMVKREEFTVAFSPDAIDVDGNTLYAEYLVGNPLQASNYVDVVCNPTAMKDLYSAYVSVVPDTSLNERTFDPICGMQFGTSLSEIPYLHIDTDTTGHVAVRGASGVALLNGSDGAFDESNPDRQAALDAAYLKAYSGEIDRNVRSKKMFPTDLILDANFPNETKIAIASLVEERKDCVGILDLGTNFNTYAGLMENLADIEPYVAYRSEAVDGYWGKIQDPVSFKIVPVTSTYALAMMYPVHFQQNGGKHVPLAGSSYAVMRGFISGSMYPVYDDDLDSDILDSLTESKVNFLKVNSVRQVVRGAQTTRQDADTNLSELSNVFVLNDIRRDAVQMCEQYEYNFSEASDLQRFNKAAGILADKYQDAQVSSITAEFSMNDWESERGILHLYIEFVHKNIIKRSIVEIDVNRGVVQG